MNIDEFIKQAQADELEDATLLTPVMYAKLRGIYPQRVYAALRNRKLEAVYCQCGRKCIDPKVADEVFGFGERRPDVETDLSEEAQVSRRDLDAEE
jgi:hypothetical protein